MLVWSEFAFAVVICAIVIYIPGLLVLRGMRFGGVMLVGFAPVLSIALIEIVVIIAGCLSVPLSGFDVVALTTLLSAFAAVLAYLYCRNTSLDRMRLHSFRFWIVPGLFLLFGVIISVIYFVKTLDGPGSFNQGPDNTWHLSLVKSFLDSGFYSPLSASLYLGDYSQASYPQNAGPMFYPAAWHCLAAVVASIANVEVTVAVNASLFVFLAIVFPLACCFFLRTIFQNSDILLWVCGAVVCMGFAAFPWWLIWFGPLYPNFVSLCLLPGVAGSFILLFRGCGMHRVILLLVCFCLSVVSLAFCQPNAVFTLAVLLFPFCIHRIYHFTHRAKSGSKLLSLAISGGFVLLVVCAWCWLHDMPFMQGVVNYSWTATESVRQALVNIAALSYASTNAQVVLALLVVFGVLYTFIRRDKLWISCAYGIACIMLLVATTTDTNFKSYLTGFWYTDPCRLAANAALIAIPLATIGLKLVVEFVLRLVRREVSKEVVKPVGRVTATVLIASFVIANYYPSFQILGVAGLNTAFGAIEQNLSDANQLGQGHVLTSSEAAFLEKVEKSVPQGALVFNCPDDGSVFAYANNDINLFYKRTGYEVDDKDGDIATILRNSIDRYGTNEDVQLAVEESGIEYILLLDVGNDLDDPDGPRYYYDHYYSELWSGLKRLTDNTPGIETVLSEGDMRLYRLSTTDLMPR